MGFLDRIRRKDEATAGPARSAGTGTAGPRHEAAASPAPGVNGTAGGAGTTGPAAPSAGAGGSGADSSADAGGSGAAGSVAAVRRAAWSALPPIQRVTARPASGPVADPGFSGRLSTWQNPSFAGTLSHAVLDSAPGGVVGGVLTATAHPVPGLEGPATELPVAPPPGSADGTGEPPPVQRAAAARVSGPRVTPAVSRPRPTPALTRATAPAAVWRRVLPSAASTAEGRTDDGGRASVTTSGSGRAAAADAPSAPAAPGPAPAGAPSAVPGPGASAPSASPAGTPPADASSADVSSAVASSARAGAESGEGGAATQVSRTPSASGPHGGAPGGGTPVRRRRPLLGPPLTSAPAAAPGTPSAGAAAPAASVSLDSPQVRGLRRPPGLPGRVGFPAGAACGEGGVGLVRFLGPVRLPRGLLRFVCFICFACFLCCPSAFGLSLSGSGLLGSVGVLGCGARAGGTVVLGSRGARCDGLRFRPGLRHRRPRREFPGRPAVVRRGAGLLGCPGRPARTGEQRLGGERAPCGCGAVHDWPFLPLPLPFLPFRSLRR